MPRLYDSPSTTIYRVNARAARFGRILAGGRRVPRDYTIVAVNVLASSPAAATDWVLSYPQLAGMPSNADSVEVTHAYKLRRQPVWIKKHGTRSARFDVIRRESGPLADTTYDN